MLTHEQVLALLRTASWSDYAIAGISFFALAKTVNYFSSSEPKMPPSPPGDPILGHARLVPFKEPYRLYAEWEKAYGDVISVNSLGYRVVIANTLSSAREILENAKFSGRPFSSLAEVAGWNSGTPFLPYNDDLRVHRRMMLKYFTPVASSSASGAALRTQIAMFLQRLLEKPELYREYSHVLVAGTIAEVVYGRKVTSVDDEHVRHVDELVHLSSQFTMLSATIFEMLPSLMLIPACLPGMGMKRHVQKLRKYIDWAVEVPFAEAKARKLSGDSSSCMVSDLLEDVGGSSRNDHEIILKNVCFSVFNAGSDTTKATLMTFFMMMALHPEVVMKAQRELDTVIGSAERLPTPEDRPHLPYVNCVLQEVYRINPPTPLGLSHTALQDVTIRDWQIPSGTVASANIWRIARDEQLYPEPEIFRPERYDVSADGTKQPEYDPSAIIFGFGRRICPGKAFADSILFITIASILSVYDIRPYTDPVTGVEVLPELENQLGLVSVPLPFKCKIVPRSERHVQLIKELDTT